jgi:hypothetical protein
MWRHSINTVDNGEGENAKMLEQTANQILGSCMTESKSLQGKAMIDRHRDGRYLIILGAAVLILLSSALWLKMDWSMADFKSLYYASKCLDQHTDPYNAANALVLVHADGIDRMAKPTIASTMDVHNPYPPTQFVFTAPLGLFSLRSAGLLWVLLSLACLLLAATAVWKTSAAHAPVLSGALIGFVLANSETVIALGNAAAIATGLCVIAAWCLLSNRYVVFGVIALSLSMMLKPQDSGLVWLFLILAGGAYKKRALQAALAALAFSAPVFLWVTLAAPHWPKELIANIAMYSAQGGINDPGPTSPLWPTAIVSLQTVISLVDNTPRHYDAVAFLFCAALFLPLAIAAFRSKVSPSNAWIGLAAIAAITMLAGYHRRNDTKLLLLCIPACALLLSQDKVRGRLALAVTAAPIFFTGDNPCTMTFMFLHHLRQSHQHLADSLQAPLQVLPAPLSIFVMAVFYVWIFVRRASEVEAQTLTPATV